MQCSRPQKYSMNGKMGNGVGTASFHEPFSIMFGIDYHTSILNSIVAGRACLETVRPADLSGTVPQKNLLLASLANKHKCHGNLCCWVQVDNSERRPLPVNPDPVVDVGPALPKLADAMSRP